MLNLLNPLAYNGKPEAAKTLPQKRTPEELRQLRIENLHKSRMFTKETQLQQPKNSQTPTLAQAPKKKKSKTEINNSWTREHKLVAIDPPIETKDGPCRYSVSFKYYDPTDKKIKKRTTKFGDKNKEYYVNHGDDNLNKRLLSNLKAYYTPFHKNFWVVSLLCNEITIQKSYTKLLSSII